MSFAFKLVLVVAILFVLGMLGLSAGAAYVGYVAKKRVAAVKEAFNHNDVGGMIAAAKGNSVKRQPLPDWKAAPPDLVSSPTSKIPLQKSLGFIETGSDPLLGDYESIFEVDSLNNDALHVHASQQFPEGQGFERFFGSHNDDTKKFNEIVCGRTIFLKDLDHSAESDGYFCRSRHEEKHPGTNAMGLSKKTLEELRATGQSQFKFHQDPLNAVFSSFKNALTAADDPASKDKAAYELMSKMMNFSPVDNGDAMETPAVDCTLQRVGTTDLSFPVMVNRQPTELPVMHITCQPKGSEKVAHLYALDDPDNPMFLAGGSDAGGHGQVTQIYWQTPKHGLEEELAKNGRAKVYDLYFDFRSDVLRPESDKVLTEIAQVMHDHPDWKLTVEGHTDNVGGDAFNLDLSKRRAASVKNALVRDHTVSADRLLTDGFGRSRPVDTNDTLEGRARNRRVELARQ